MSYNIDSSLSTSKEIYRYQKNLTLEFDHNIQITKESDRQGQPYSWHRLWVLHP